jgi:hypothetical protein
LIERWRSTATPRIAPIEDRNAYLGWLSPSIANSPAVPI